MLRRQAQVSQAQQKAARRRATAGDIQAKERVLAQAQQKDARRRATAGDIEANAGVMATNQAEDGNLCPVCDVS
jgi:hypothetical protein